MELPSICITIWVDHHFWNSNGQSALMMTFALNFMEYITPKEREFYELKVNLIGLKVVVDRYNLKFGKKFKFCHSSSFMKLMCFASKSNNVCKSSWACIFNCWCFEGSPTNRSKLANNILPYQVVHAQDNCTLLQHDVNSLTAWSSTKLLQVVPVTRLHLAPQTVFYE